MNRLLIILLFWLPATTQADVAVLVHGYLGNAASWDYSGVSQTLERDGWRRAGVLTPRGLMPLQGESKGSRFYTAERPVSVHPVTDPPVPETPKSRSFQETLADWPAPCRWSRDVGTAGQAGRITYTCARPGQPPGRGGP